MKRRSWFIALCYLCLLAGCASPAVPTPSQPAPTSMPRPTLTATLAPTASPTATRFPTRTQTPTATQTSTSTITPTPTISLTPSVTPPPDQYTLSVGNVAQVQELARMGRGRLQSIAWSKDGRLLVLGTSLGIHIYNAQTLQQIRYIYTGTRVGEIAISPDGKTIATSNERVHLWDADTGTGKGTLDGSMVWITHLEFSAGGTLLAAVGYDNGPGPDPAAFFLWNMRTSELLYRKQFEVGGYGLDFIFSPDGRTIAMILGDYVWLNQALTGENIKFYENLYDYGTVGFTPDSRGLYIFTNDRKIHLIDIETDEVMYSRPFLAGWDHLVLSPDGKTLAKFGANQLFLDIDSGDLKFKLQGIEENPTPSFSPDGERLAAVSGEDLHIWEMETGTSVGVIKWDSVVTSLAFGTLSIPGRLQQTVLVTGNLQGLINVSPVFSLEPAITVDFDGQIIAVALNPEGNILAAGVREGERYRIELFDLENYQPMRSIDVNEGNGLWGLAFSQDGEAVAAAISLYNGIQAWKIRTGELVNVPEQKTWQDAGDIGANSSGRLTWLYLGETSYQIKDHYTDEVLVEPSFTDELMYCEDVLNYAFSSDGRYFTLGCGWPTFAVWDVSKQQLAHRLEGHEPVIGDGFAASITDVEFSPYGYLLASSGWDDTVRFWDTHRGRLLLTLSDHSCKVTDIAFSPDGRYLASTSCDGTVRLYGLRP